MIDIRALTEADAQAVHRLADAIERARLAFPSHVVTPYIVAQAIAVTFPAAP